MKLSDIIRLPLVWAGVLALSALLGIGATVISIDDRYAHAEEMKQVVKTIEALNQRIEQQSKSDRMLAIQERIWQIQDRYREKPMPVDTLEELRFLQLQLEEWKQDK